MNSKLTASLLILAAVLANLAFTALGSVFNYPDVLDEPAGQVLAAFRDNQGAVSGWFSVLALSAALLAPIAIGVGRLSSERAMRIAVPVGIAAAAVQVIGLLRWPILVPGYASDAASGNAGVAQPPATRSRRRATSSARPSARRSATSSPPRGRCSSSSHSGGATPDAGSRCWARCRRCSSLAGVLSPLGLPVIDTANFFGYVLWSVWLIAFAVVILVHERRRATAPAPREPDRGDGMTTAERTALAPDVPRVPARRLRRSADRRPGRRARRGALRRRHHRHHPRRGPVVGHGPERSGLRASGSPRPPRVWLVGLALGASAVGYGTSLGDLVVQGAICGLAIGTAQALVLRGRIAYLWAPALSALWALGWAITTSIGIDVETQWAVFGSSGALVVTAATAVLPVLLATRTTRTAS